MGINNDINVNLKKLTKAENSEKTAKKEKKPSFAGEEKSIDKKSYSNYSKATRAAIGAMILASTLGLGSCVEQEQYVENDNSELVAIMSQLLAENAAMREQMNTLILLMQQNNADNAELKKLLAELVKNSDYQSKVLSEISNGVLSVQEGIQALVAYAKAANAMDQEFAKKLDEIIKGQGSAEEKLQAILDATNEQNQILLNVATLISSLGDKLSGQIQEFFEAYKAGNMSMTELITAIFNEIKQADELNAKNDAEFLKKLDQIIKGQGTNGEKLDKLTKETEKQTKLLSCIKSLINGVSKKLSKQIGDFYNAYLQGSMTQTELLNNIYSALKESNDLSQQQLAKLDQIIANIKSGNIDRAEGMAQILDMLGIISEQLGSIMGQLSSILNGINAQTNEMNNFKVDVNNRLDDLKEGNITTQAFLAQVVSQLASLNVTDASILSQIANLQVSIENNTISDQQAHAQVLKLLKEISKNTDVQNSIGGVIVAKLTNIETAIQNGTMSEEEALAAITALLQQISNNTDEIVEGMHDISAQISQLSKNISSYQNKSLKLLAGIKGNTANINDKLNQVIKNQKDGNKISMQMLHEMDEAVGLLYKLNGKTVTKNDLKNLFGDFYNKIEPYLQNINNSSEIDLTAVIEAIQNNKTDLTKTNALIETLTNVVQNLDLSGGTDAIQSVLNKLDVIINKGGADADDIVKLLEQALGELASINGNTEQILNVLKSIDSKVGSIDKKIDDLLKEADLANATLNHIDKKTVTLPELKQLIGDYFNQIEPYLKNIGAGNGEIDLSDVIAAINASKTDLTKTNALIETLTNVVQNLDFSGDTNYYAASLNKIYEVLNKIHADGTADAAKTQALIQEAINLLNNIKTNGDSQLDVLNAILATAKDMKANQDKAFEASLKAEANFYNNFEAVVDAIKTGNGISEQMKKDLEKLAEDAQKANDAAQQARAQQLAVLEAILANMGGGSGEGVTIEQLKQVIPDYTDILNEIADKIGKVVTSSDLQNFFLKTQPDLTKTNALIETLTNVVQNIDVSGTGGSADMSRVESLLGQILDKLSAGQQPTQAQMQDLINAVNQVATNTATTRSYILASNGDKTYLAPEFQYYLGSHVSDDTIYLG